MVRTSSGTLVRCESAAQVQGIALANHAECSLGRYAASVTLPGVTYFWSAA